MKLRSWAAVTIFVSSYAPLALIFVLKDLNPYTGRPEHPRTVIFLLAVGLISVLVVLGAVASIKQGDWVRIQRVSNQSGELVNYTIPYMISFFGFDLGDWRALIAFVVFLMLLFVLTMRTQNIFINPVLALAGYGLYEVEYFEASEVRQATFLAKQDVRVGGRCQIRRISRFFYVVTQAG